MPKTTMSQNHHHRNGTDHLGILKKSSDYSTLQSRESSPEDYDDLSRPTSRFSSDSSGTTNGKKKSIRFADETDDLDSTTKSVPSDDYSHLESWLRTPKKGSDHSVEKYFDNLISMIEDAAEGL